MIKRVSILALSIIFYGDLFGQSAYIPLNADYYYLLDRYEIKSGKFSPNYFTSFKPYRRDHVAGFIDSLSHKNTLISESDRFNLSYLGIDSWEFTRSPDADSEKALWKKLYRKKSDFVHVDVEDFDLHLNPVIYWAVGNDGDSDPRPFVNTRGVELRGRIDNRIAFYSFLGENQTVFPFYGQEYVLNQGAVPGEGFWKEFENRGVDFFTARGYIDFQISKHIDLQFGHDKNFIGNGIRSMFLSDFSSNYFFLKLNTKVWRLNYTNLFAELIADAPFTGLGGVDAGSIGTLRFPKKYMAAHHLSVNITDKLNIGIFESTIFSNEDSVGGRFELNYLNPIVFYRAVEQAVGSPDNVVFGMDVKWNPRRKLSIYAQALLDEIIVDELFSGSGWWGNKLSGQVGVKYIDALGMENLDLQGEYNFSRPFTYSHTTTFTSYSHYRQPLAHPLGANFREFIGVARYQPIPRLTLTGKIILVDQGLNPEGEDLGADILLPNPGREMDFNNEIGQGIETQISFFDITASYQLRHNLFIDLKQTFRQLDSQINSQDLNTVYTAIALRLNAAQRLLDF